MNSEGWVIFYCRPSMRREKEKAVPSNCSKGKIAIRGSDAPEGGPNGLSRGVWAAIKEALLLQCSLKFERNSVRTIKGPNRRNTLKRTTHQLHVTREGEGGLVIYPNLLESARVSNFLRREAKSRRHLETATLLDAKRKGKCSLGFTPSS